MRSTPSASLATHDVGLEEQPSRGRDRGCTGADSVGAGACLGSTVASVITMSPEGPNSFISELAQCRSSLVRGRASVLPGCMAPGPRVWRTGPKIAPVCTVVPCSVDHKRELGSEQNNTLPCDSMPVAAAAVEEGEIEHDDVRARRKSAEKLAEWFLRQYGRDGRITHQAAWRVISEQSCACRRCRMLARLDGVDEVKSDTVAVAKD